MKLKLKKKVNINNFFFLIFLTLYLISLNLFKLDLAGTISIVIVAIITFYYTSMYKYLATILYVALGARLIVILLGHHFIELPDWVGDNTQFELFAWKFSRDGFFGVFSNFPINKSSYHISWIIAFFYSLTDRSFIMGQSISLLFGIGSIILASRIANKIWGEKISIKVGWILALYPTLILYSCLILRESYVWFFLLVVVYGLLDWSKKKTFTSFIIISIGFFGASFYHGAMIIGGFAFLGIVSIMSFIEIQKKLKYLKISINSIAFLSFALILLLFLISIGDSIPKIKSLKHMLNAETIILEIENRNKNSAAFPEWTVPKDKFELMYKAPIRIIYFMLSPFPWDIKKTTHLFGLFDGIFQMMILFLFLKNFKSIWSNKSLRIIIIVLAIYIILFGLASGNFGTGLRHRTKFLIVLILMIAPWIPKLVFGKKQRNNNYKNLNLN